MRQLLLTQERLRELFNYDGHTGKFTWRVSRGRVKTGAVAGSLRTDGYIRLTIDDCKYRAHRLAWLYVHGRWPQADLDHANGQRSDNRIANLRECTRAENMQNYGRPSTKKSALPLGVSPFRSKYQAHIRHSGKRRRLGLFPTPELAYEAYLAAKAELHKFQPAPREGRD